jgi:tetratricopeptide (TPR) repeat protein
LAKINQDTNRISQICQDLKETSQQCEQNAIPISSVASINTINYFKDEDDKDVHKLTDHIREKTFSHARGWCHLDMVLYAMNQFQKSQQVYQVLIDQLTNESEKISIYRQLRLVKNYQRDYPEAIIFHEKSLEIYKKTLPPNHLNLTTSYNNIDLISDNMGEYSKALSSHKKALEIQQQSLPSNHSSLTIQLQTFSLNHPDLASSFVV